MPDGTAATALTQGEDWYSIVTSENKILIYDKSTNELRQTKEISN